MALITGRQPRFWAVVRDGRAAPITISVNRRESIRRWCALWVDGRWSHHYRRGARCIRVEIREAEPVVRREGDA